MPGLRRIAQSDQEPLSTKTSNYIVLQKSIFAYYGIKPYQLPNVPTLDDAWFDDYDQANPESQNSIYIGGVN